MSDDRTAGPHDFATDEWWRRRVLEQRRDGERLRVMVSFARRMFDLFGIKLLEIQVDAERGRARGAIYAMLNPLDATDMGLATRGWDPSDTTIVEIEGVKIRGVDRR